MPGWYDKGTNRKHQSSPWFTNSSIMPINRNSHVYDFKNFIYSWIIAHWWENFPGISVCVVFMHRVRSRDGFQSWGEIGSSQPSSWFFGIYFYAVLSASSTSHPALASFPSLSNNALIKVTIWHRHSLLILLDAVWAMFVQLYSVSSNQERLGNMLMSFLHKSREHAQVRIMWLEFLFLLLLT